MHSALAALLLLTPLAAAAGDAPSAPPAQSLEDRARRALELFSNEVTDLLRGLGDGLDRLDDYGPPQILPNGDILIPRRRDAPPEAPAPSVDL